jgi:hypothetical protein
MAEHSRDWYAKKAKAEPKHEAKPEAKDGEESMPMRHGREMTDMHGRHEQEQADMHKRHKKERGDMAERHAAEMGAMMPEGEEPLPPAQQTEVAQSPNAAAPAA